MHTQIPIDIITRARSADFVSFDNDGTILESLDFAYEAFIKAYAELDSVHHFGVKPIEKDVFKSLMGLPWFEFYKFVLPLSFQHLADEIHDCIAKYELEALAVGRARWFADVKDTLYELKKRKLRLVLVSNASQQYFDACIEALDYREFFDACYCVANTGLTKTGLIEKAMRELNLRKGIMVGDKESDIVAGADCGLLTIGASYGYGSQDELKNADFTIANISELIFLL